MNAERNSPEIRAKISESLRRYYSDPALRAAISGRQTGRPSRGAHTTNHARRGVSKPESCVFCREQEADNG